jgi:hypothetical protein
MHVRCVPLSQPLSTTPLILHLDNALFKSAAASERARDLCQVKPSRAEPSRVEEMVPMHDRSGSRPATALPPVVGRRRRRGYVTARAFFSWLCACCAARGTHAVLLDFEGIGDVQVVGSYYGGQPGGGPDYGIVFGPSVFSGVDEDAGGSYTFANEPSPNTTVLILGDESECYVTVVGGFTALSFRYTSSRPVNITVHAGPNGTGTVLGSSTIPRVGFCGVDFPPCGDPSGYYGVWRNFTAPFSGGGGVATSASFSIGYAYFFVDDMVIALAPPPTTKAPTTKRPSRFPTASPTRACRTKGRKGSMMRCEKKPRALGSGG